MIWSSGIGGIKSFFDECLGWAAGDGTPRFSPFFIPRMISDIAAGFISMKYGFMGPNYCTVSACASSNHGMIAAFDAIRYGKADVMVAGGSEAAVNEPSVGGFNSMQALSTRNDDPQHASRPFDKDRDGFVIGEGAGALIFEEYEHAKARGAKIYCEIIGGGASADAYHFTVALTTHVCRGNYHSTWASRGGYAPIAPILFAHENVDAFYLEFDDERSGNFEPLGL